MGNKLEQPCFFVIWLLKMSTKIELKWDAVNIREWRELVAWAGQSNLLQTWPYAQMLLMTERQRVCFGTFHKGQKIIAFCQVIRKTIFGIYHIAHIHRGPLWTEQPPTAEDERAVLQILRTHFPRRPWRLNRFLFDLHDSEEKRHLLLELGYKPRPGEGYHSGWVRLDRSENDILSSFKGRWRTALKKSATEGLTLELDRQGTHLGWVMQRNELDKKWKKFGGPSLQQMTQLCRFTRRNNNFFFLLRALQGNRPVAGIILIKHEQAATYLVGWSDRSTQAHNFLLWEAIKILKSEQTRWLDLGGVHPEKAKGLTAFKRGLSPEEYKLIGTWC